MENDLLRTTMAREVLTYLAQHPGAQDTVEGIAHWWLLECEIRRQLENVEVAVEQLVAAGLVERRDVPYGHPRYSLNPSRIEEVRALLTREG